ncbi:MAG: undecaprenyldiphospho-muramoylpentapeptide beta-N-acetylglucosaminyltransferase [candidate division Zixibacteria bacterium]
MSGSESERILFAGGGTAGHLMPAINIATEMTKMNRKIKPLFVGKKGGMEQDIVGRYGYEIEEIDVIGMKRTPRGVIRFIMNWNTGNKQAMKIIREYDPAIVIGTGGYVSAPIIRAAHKMKKRIFLQEQNSLPGLALRSVARYADIIFIAYDSARSYFDESKCCLTGNPIRTDIGNRDPVKSKGKFGLDVKKKTLLVLGGSSGASSINETVSKLVSDFTHDDWQLLWQTGNRDYNRYYEKTTGKVRGALFPFIDDMPSAYAAADLVLSRAGAMALSEITAAGLPSVLIPYPHATGDHQTMNARVLEKAGAAVVVAESEINLKLKAALDKMMTNDIERSRIGKAAGAIGNPDAAREIAKTILERI